MHNELDQPPVKKKSNCLSKRKIVNHNSFPIMHSGKKHSRSGKKVSEMLLWYIR